MELIEDAWAGKSCVIVGGGPSLRSFRWEWLKGRPHTIVVNRAFINVPTAAIWFTEDARTVPLWGAQLRQFKGLKVWHALETSEIEAVKAIDPSIHIIHNRREDKHWSHSFADGLSYSSNSVVGAMNIATILNANPIYLLGVDCRSEGLMMQNFHDDYRSDPMWEVGSNAADNFKNDFEGWVGPHVKDRTVVSLINPEYPTALTCWPKVPWGEHFK